MTNCATPDFESPGRLQTRKLNLKSVESCPSLTFQRNEIINLPKSPSIANYANAIIPDIPSREDTPSASVTHDVPTVSEDHEMHGRKIRNLQFKKESALIQHSRIYKSHAQRRPTHSCNTCSYASVHQSTFRRHLKNPNGDVIICMYAFTTKFNCERHVKHVHKIISKADIQNAMRRNMPCSEWTCSTFQIHKIVRLTYKRLCVLMSFKCGAGPSTAEDGSDDNKAVYLQVERNATVNAAECLSETLPL
ncbi:hypothetical protein CEXT_66461 [Caerostris extrusa]|uniref:C2H2-type domain-containing protein n=1 Tax=Caerostris extrusa TaxID=172846 RepID=A0AAV4THS5_CAEEX|nr:hypothetical protein CEXT_66461 [Caerostris extrusa]